MREPRRSALGLLYTLFEGCIPALYTPWLEHAFAHDELRLLTFALAKGVNAPLCSSIGRLFDAVSALLDCCLLQTFEGEAALALEAIASSSHKLRYRVALLQRGGLRLIDWRPLVRDLYADNLRGIPPSALSYAFHEALAAAITALAEYSGQEKILLTGGCMQNKLLAELTIAGLRRAGFQPYWHKEIPPNDGGLAVGQIARIGR